MPVTIEDIAKKVGRSITTVSRALHGYDDVSAETKALVHKVAAELGYVPSTTAQRLQKRRTDTIGLVLPTFGPRFSDPFFSEFLAGVGNVTAEWGYDLLVSTHAPGVEELQAYQAAVQSRRVDGFIVVRTRQHDPRIQYLREVGFPFVAFGRTEGELDFPFVDVNCESGLQQVVDHLVAYGHRRIACIISPVELMFTQLRLKGLKAGLEAQGIPFDQVELRYGDLTQRGGYALAQELLKSTHPPTAIIAFNDLMALGAMSAVQDFGWKVGVDLSIVGFDDISLAEHSHPPLTTVNQPIYSIGSMVCEMLVNLLLGTAINPSQIILDPSLVVRTSSGPVQADGTKGQPVK